MKANKIRTYPSFLGIVVYPRLDYVIYSDNKLFPIKLDRLENQGQRA